MSSMEDFLLFLANIVLLNEDDDRLRWTLKNNEILTFACIIMFYEALPLSLFLGKVFGEWRLLDEFHFLFGLWLGIRYSLGIIWRIRGLILLIGAACVDIVGRMWTICWSIVRRLNSYGVSSFNLLGFHGSYQEQCSILCLDGGIGWGNTCQTFGI